MDFCHCRRHHLSFWPVTCNFLALQNQGHGDLVRWGNLSSSLLDLLQCLAAGFLVLGLGGHFDFGMAVVAQCHSFDTSGLLAFGHGGNLLGRWLLGDAIVNWNWIWELELVAPSFKVFEDHYSCLTPCTQLGNRNAP